MSAQIGSLAVRVGADTSGLVKGLKDSSARLDQFGSKVRSGATDFAKYGAAAAAAGAALATAVVANSIAAARETSNLARIANTTAGEFTRLAYAAKSVGVQQDKFSDILKDTSDRVGDFLSTGGGPMADFFENIAPKVGVTAEQFRNLSGPQALQLYVSSLEKANISQNEMTFYMEAMASDATALIPLLRDGGAALNEQARMADRLGVALSSIEVEQMNQAAIAMEQAGSVLSGFGDQFAAELSPVLTALSTQFLRAAEDAGGVGEAASSAFDYVVKAVGFVMDSVEGVRRVFELAGSSIALFALSAQNAMLAVAEAIINRPIQALDQLIAGINEFTGSNFEPIGITKLGESIRQELAMTNTAIGIAQQDMHDILMRELPSGQFEQFVAEAVKASEAAAVEAVRIQESLIGGTGGGAGMSGEASTALAGKLEAIRQANLTEIELLREKHELELEEIARAEEAKIELDGTYKDLREDTEKRHQDELTKIEKQAADARNRAVEKEARAKQQIMSGALSGLTTLMNSESRKMFEIGKAAAITQATMSTYTGMAKALELGWPLGPIAAGAIGAAGFAKVQAINSTSFGSSGGASGSSTQAVNDSAAPVAATSERSVSINVGLVGGNDRDRALAGGLLDQINEEIERGGRISRVGLA